MCPYSDLSFDTDVTTWELPEGAIARLARGRVEDMSFSSDGRYLAIATPIGCWLYDLPTLTPCVLFETERGMLDTVAFSHDTKWIATCNKDNIIKVWDTQNFQCRAKIDHRKNVNSSASGFFSNLNFSRDNEYLAASSFEKQNVVYAWQKNTDEPTANFPIKVEDTRVYKFPVCFSPVENLLAYVSSGTPQNTITITDLITGEHILHFRCSAPLARHGLTFSPCGQYLAACNTNNEVIVWGLDHECCTLEMVSTTIYDGVRVTPAYTSDGTLRVADQYDSKVVIWDAIRRKKIDTLTYTGHGASCFSTDGNLFAKIVPPSDICVWSVGSHQSKKLSAAGHTPVAHSVTFSKNGKLIASGHTFGMSLVFWNVAQRKTAQILPTPRIKAQHTLSNQNLTENNRLHWQTVLSPCEELLVIKTTQGGIIEVYQIATETLIAQLPDSEKYGRKMMFSPTGEHFIGSSPSGDICVWNTEIWKKICILKGHNRQITNIAFHPDGQQFTTISKDVTARVWDLGSGNQIGLLSTTQFPEDISLYIGDPEQIRQYISQVKRINNKEKRYNFAYCPETLAFSPCGTVLAGGHKRCIELLDSTTFKTYMLILLPESSRKPFALTFSPCGKYLVSGSWWVKGLEKVSIRLWEVTSGENIATFWGHVTDVQDLAFSPDGLLLASGSYDGTILLWDMKPFISGITNSM